MMTFHAPSPGSLSLGIAKQAEVIELGVANRTAAFLDLAKHVFQAHDRGGFCEPLLIQPATEQHVGELAPGLVEILERNALPRPWYVMPVKPLLVFERKSGLDPALGRHGID